jgi:hypothetical protein
MRLIIACASALGAPLSWSESPRGVTLLDDLVDDGSARSPTRRTRKIVGARTGVKRDASGSASAASLTVTGAQQILIGGSFVQ